MNQNEYNRDCNCDSGPNPYAANMPCVAVNNQNYRTAFWTGNHLQLTLMCIPAGDDIGVEIHEDTDQYIRVEEGNALAMMGQTESCMNMQWELCAGDAIFVPSGTWHNVINISNCPLKLTSVYAPPHHPHGTIHQTKEDSQKSEYK